MRKIFDQQQLEFIKNNYSIHGTKYCAEALGFTREQIKGKASQLGCKLPKELKEKQKIETRSENRNKTLSKIDFDSIIDLSDPYILYLLGYIWADGSVTGNKKYKNKYVTLAIAEEDGNELLPIINKLKINKDWTNHSYPQKNNWKTIMNISNFDWIFAEYLRRLGFCDKSSEPPTKLFSIIGDAYKKFFILGFFDGDGSVSVAGGGEPTRISVCFAGPANQNWDFIIEFMNSIDIDCRISIDSRGKGSTSLVSIRKRKDCYKFLKFLYQERDTLKLGLSRKFNKLKQYENNIMIRTDHLYKLYCEYEKIPLLQ